MANEILICPKCKQKAILKKVYLVTDGYFTVGIMICEECRELLLSYLWMEFGAELKKLSGNILDKTSIPRRKSR